jgi:hypothetical protein
MVALQTMKLESHMPPQIDPPVEIVAMLGLLLVNVMSTAMVAPAAFCAIAEIVVTSPSFNETVVGERMIVAGMGVFVLLPPQPARRERQMAVKSAARTRTTENCRMYPPRRTQMPAESMKAKIIPVGKPSV